MSLMLACTRTRGWPLPVLRYASCSSLMFMVMSMTMAPSSEDPKAISVTRGITLSIKAPVRIGDQHGAKASQVRRAAMRYGGARVPAVPPPTHGSVRAPAPHRRSDRQVLWRRGWDLWYLPTGDFHAHTAGSVRRPAVGNDWGIVTSGHSRIYVRRVASRGMTR